MSDIDVIVKGLYHEVEELRKAIAVIELRQKQLPREFESNSTVESLDMRGMPKTGDQFKQAEEGPRTTSRSLPHPRNTDSPVFNAIWNCIKTWDINVPGYYMGYMGATGNHVQMIYDAVKQMLRER